MYCVDSLIAYKMCVCGVCVCVMSGLQVSVEFHDLLGEGYKQERKREIEVKNTHSLAAGLDRRLQTQNTNY